MGAPGEVAGERAGPRTAALRTVFAAQVTNTAGSGISSVALPLLVFQSAGIAATALVFVVVALPGLLFGLHAGALADRFNRKTLVVTGNLLQGGMLAGVPVTYWDLGVAGVAVLAFVSKSFGVFAAPATSAALPELAGDTYQQLLGKLTALNFLARPSARPSAARWSGWWAPRTPSSGTRRRSSSPGS
jgi:MFS family permease